MKISKLLLTQFCVVLFALNASAELQRLSIVPQKLIKLSNDLPGQAKSICIDYHREAPTVDNTLDKEPYDQVYSEGNTVIKINGIITNRSFKSLVQSDNPLLLLQPTSLHNIEISLNPLNPESKGIKSIEIEFKTNAEVGNIKDDRDVKQAETIFKNWGAEINQNDFWKRSKCLDILSKNSKLKYNPNGELLPESKAFCDKVFTTFDFDIFDHKLFKYLVDNNYYTIDENTTLTKESIERITQAYYYQQAITDVKKINPYSEDINKLKEMAEKYLQQQSLYSIFSNPTKPEPILESQLYDLANLQLKKEFYSTENNLTSIEKDNQNIRDTIINGLRYVLMVAWKSNSFIGYVKNVQGSLPTYQSNEQFFKFPLFMTTRYDIERFCAENNLSEMSENARRTRLMQVLGLPPNSTNDIFVEFWVNEKDLFRPAVDSTLKSSMLLFKLSIDYIKSFATFSSKSYENTNILNQYPFTGMGYTWDYCPNSKDHFGVTEFVLKENKVIFVRGTASTNDYIKNLKKRE